MMAWFIIIYLFQNYDVDMTIDYTSDGKFQHFSIFFKQHNPFQATRTQKKKTNLSVLFDFQKHTGQVTAYAVIVS